ncbi:hypothetical protein CSA17_04865 [bacterium DOLJORAL78_65_58]|nr:MAG: hypothetical protein CSA17_04865 [bacterium DOLJORAL78_65_58]
MESIATKWRFNSSGPAPFLLSGLEPGSDLMTTIPFSMWPTRPCPTRPRPAACLLLLGLLLLNTTVLAGDGTFPGRLGAEVRPGVREGSLQVPDTGSPAAAPATSRVFSLSNPAIAGQSDSRDGGLLLYDGFETGLSSDLWTLQYQGSGPYWGDWTCWASAGSRSAGCAADGAGAISCGGSYPNGMQAWMISGPYDLNVTGITGGTFQCDLNLVCEEAGSAYYDFFFMGVSLNGINYQGHVYAGTHSGTVTLDLSNVPEFGSVLGQDQVWFAFMFQSDETVTESNGAQIDEARITVDVPGSNEAPQVALTDPNGGGILPAGVPTTITYTATDPDSGPQALSIALDYSTDSGASWTNITTGQSNTGSYSWTVPNVTTSTARVRVRATDGAAEVADVSDADFSITQNSNANTLSLGSGTGASGTTVTVPLSLDNEDAVKGVQLDITLDGATAFLAGVTSSERGAGMVAQGAMVDSDRARVVLYHDTAAQIAAGSGEIARLSFTLQGAGGISSVLAPTDMVLSGPAGEALAVTGSNGQLQISAPTDVPLVQVVALKNPGRTRTLQVMVHVTNGTGAPPTVTAGGISVPVASASATNNHGTGTGQTTVSFP